MSTFICFPSMITSIYRIINMCKSSRLCSGFTTVSGFPFLYWSSKIPMTVAISPEDICPGP